MVNARRRNAPRKGIAAILVALLVPAAPAFAGGGQFQLILPLVAALSLGRSAAHYASAGSRPAGGGGVLARILPAQLRIPTMEPEPYELLESPRYTSGIDTDLLVGVDLLGRRRGGWMLSLRVEDESRVPLAGGSNAVGIRAEKRF
jgi:hypothetical protein